MVVFGQQKDLIRFAVQMAQISGGENIVVEIKLTLIDSI